MGITEGNWSDGDGPQVYRAFVTSNLLFPIASIIGELEALDPEKTPNEVQTSMFENGYAGAAILLIVAMLESFSRLAQLRLVGSASWNARDWIRERFAAEYDVDAVDELFVVRDVIAHNHSWDAEIEWDEAGSPRFTRAALQDGEGGARFKRAADLEKRVTRKLGLNVFPTRIWRRDALIVLRETTRFLHHLEGCGLIGVSGHYVKCSSGELIRFKDWVDGLRVPPN
jgi:hypothetical protein